MCEPVMIEKSRGQVRRMLEDAADIMTVDCVVRYSLRGVYMKA